MEEKPGEGQSGGVIDPPLIVLNPPRRRKAQFVPVNAGVGILINEGRIYNISGLVGSVGGDIVGRDKIIGIPTAAELDGALRLLSKAIEAAPAEARSEADAKLAALKQEAAKGKDANDRTIADLVDGLVKLVPGAVSAVVSAFATPILGGIAGPVTGFVLDKLRGK